jgi:hypothetical protein
MRLMESLYEIVEAKKQDIDNAFLAESAGVDDFANILGSQMNRTLLNAYRGVNQPWRQYTKQSEVNDFRTNDRIMGSEAEDLLPLGPGGAGPYQDSRLTEQKYSIRASTKGRAFSITRHALINDDLNYLRDQPARFGRAAARTLTKEVVNTVLEGNLPAYDGQALFHVNHGNLLTGAAPASSLTAANLNTARIAIQKSRFEGEFTGLQPKYLIVPPELEVTARTLLNSDWIPAPGTGIGNINPFQNSLELIVDQWLTSATAWYVAADPAEAPAIDVAFLPGRQQPDLLVQKPEYRFVVGGGEDEYMHGEFDELRYAVRYDWGIAVAMWQGIFKGAGV